MARSFVDLCSRCTCSFSLRSHARIQETCRQPCVMSWRWQLFLQTWLKTEGQLDPDEVRLCIEQLMCLSKTKIRNTRLKRDLDIAWFDAWMTDGIIKTSQLWTIPITHELLCPKVHLNCLRPRNDFSGIHDTQTCHLTTIPVHVRPRWTPLKRVRDQLTVHLQHLHETCSTMHRRPFAWCNRELSWESVLVLVSDVLALYCGYFCWAHWRGVVATPWVAIVVAVRTLACAVSSSCEAGIRFSLSACAECCWCVEARAKPDESRSAVLKGLCQALAKLDRWWRALEALRVGSRLLHNWDKLHNPKLLRSLEFACSVCGTALVLSQFSEIRDQRLILCWTAGYPAIATLALDSLVSSILWVLSITTLLNLSETLTFDREFVAELTTVAMSKVTDRLAVWDEGPHSIDDFAAHCRCHRELGLATAHACEKSNVELDPATGQQISPRMVRTWVSALAIPFINLPSCESRDDKEFGRTLLSTQAKWARVDERQGTSKRKSVSPDMSTRTSRANGRLDRTPSEPAVWTSTKLEQMEQLGWRHWSGSTLVVRLRRAWWQRSAIASDGSSSRHSGSRSQPKTSFLTWSVAGLCCRGQGSQSRAKKTVREVLKTCWADWESWKLSNSDQINSFWSTMQPRPWLIYARVRMRRRSRRVGVVGAPEWNRDCLERASWEMGTGLGGRSWRGKLKMISDGFADVEKKPSTWQELNWTKLLPRRETREKRWQRAIMHGIKSNRGGYCPKCEQERLRYWKGRRQSSQAAMRLLKPTDACANKTVTEMLPSWSRIWWMSQESGALKLRHMPRTSQRYVWVLMRWTTQPWWSCLIVATNTVGSVEAIEEQKKTLELGVCGYQLSTRVQVWCRVKVQPGGHVAHPHVRAERVPVLLSAIGRVGCSDQLRDKSCDLE